VYEPETLTILLPRQNTCVCSDVEKE